jgi:hypothetical protein
MQATRPGKISDLESTGESTEAAKGVRSQITEAELGSPGIRHPGLHVMLSVVIIHPV